MQEEIHRYSHLLAPYPQDSNNLAAAAAAMAAMAERTEVATLVAGKL